MYDPGKDEKKPAFAISSRGSIEKFNFLKKGPPNFNKVVQAIDAFIWDLYWPFYQKVKKPKMSRDDCPFKQPLGLSQPLESSGG